MKNELPQFTARQFRFGVWLVAAFFVSLPVALAVPQSTPSSTQVQRDAMRKLAFLAGRWTGPVTVVRGRGEPLHLTQTEDVQYKLDGLVLLIEGKSMSTEGKVLFNALATVAYDDASHAYRFRAYEGGHYLDTALTVLAHGFSWGFTAGPARIVNTMHLTAKGEWSEVTEVTVGNTPPHRSVEMLLQHQP